MAGRPALSISPHTCADNFYAISGAQPVTMFSLQNLVPAPNAVDQWIPRPGAVELPNSGSLFTPGVISCMVVVGSRLYGMISSNAIAGHDIPFCYDLIGANFIVIAGATSANTPVSLPANGSWTPPHAELVGIYVVITHPNFPGSGANYFGMINTTPSATPTYNSYALTVGTGGTVLPVTPIWCAQFNQRAYFLVNPLNAPPAAIFSDVLSPSTFQTAGATYNNVLTFGGNLPLTCAGTTAYNNQLGGQTQALVIFQGASNVQQVTGDPAVASTGNSNLYQGQFQINSMNVATGTLAPNTICRTPQGLAFVAPDGLRIIDLTGRISDPVGFGGSGICQPFISSSTPSRMAAACNATTIRISTINSSIVNSPQQEWCYDLVRKVWYGPHTFPVSLIAFYNTSFVASGIALPGIWSTDVIPNSSSIYTENSLPMTCVLQTGYLPDRPNIEEISCTRGVFYQSYGGGTTTYNVSALDINGAVIPGGFVTPTFTGSSTTWGSFTWGSSVWLGSASNLAATQLQWTQPLVFDRMALQITFQASDGIRLANILLELDEQDYTVLST